MLSEELLKENHEICLQLVDKFLSVCNKYNIIYYVTEGSALGVVRHHGFIPWDINFDVHLTVEEYDRLNEAMEKEELGEFVWWKPKNRMCALLMKKGFVNHETHPNIDVTIMGNISDNYFVRKIQLEIAFFNIKMFKLKNTDVKRKYPYNVLKIVASFFPDSFYFGILDMFKHINQDLKTTYLTAYTPSFHGNSELIKREWIGENITYGDFEGRKVRILEKSHDYLAHRYGDYMTPVVWKGKGEYKND